MEGQVNIRADGSSSIGLGHIVRCISLAHMVKNEFDIHFYSLSLPDSLQKEIQDEGWEVTLINQESNFMASLRGNEIVVLDGYQFDSSYQKKIKDTGTKLVCIDDFHDQYFYADIVINHAPGLTEEEYEGEAYTKYLLGPKYALLRPEFLEQRNQNEKAFKSTIKNIFICFGGSDFKNLTCKTLSWIPGNDYNVTVVVGNAYIHIDKLEKIIEERNDLDVQLKSSLSAGEMRNEIEEADLAIVPCSGLLFETVAVGLPVISGFYTDNQRSVYSGFKSRNVFYDAYDLEKGNFLEAFNQAVNKNSFQELINNQKECVDGLSPNRIKRRIRGLYFKSRFTIREAELEDMEQYFEWANDDSVRSNAFNPEKIVWEEHVKWFKNRLNRKDSKMYIFEIDGKGIGQVRYDRNDEGWWDIDYMLDESFRGYGLGREILISSLIKIKSEIKDIKIQALVKRDNIPSLKVFEDLEFSKQKSKDGVIKFTYEK